MIDWQGLNTVYFSSDTLVCVTALMFGVLGAGHSSGYLLGGFVPHETLDGDSNPYI